MQRLLTAIDDLSDVQAITAARQLSRRIFSAVTLDVLRPAAIAAVLRQRRQLPSRSRGQDRGREANA